MSILKECNRCGDTFRKNAITMQDESGVGIPFEGVDTSVGHLDFCDKCGTEFQEFMENKKGVILLDPDKTTCGDCSRRIAKPNPTPENMFETRFCTVFMRVTENHEKMCQFFCPKKK